MSKNRTPPDSRELSEAEEGFRRWLLPKGCSDLIDVGSSERPAAKVGCEFCGTLKGIKLLPLGFDKFNAICGSCATLLGRAWKEVEAESAKIVQDSSKSTWEVYVDYKALCDKVRRRVLEMVATGKS